MIRYFIFSLLFFTASIHSQEDSQDKKLELLKKYSNSATKEKILLLKMLIQTIDNKEKSETKKQIDKLKEDSKELQLKLGKSLDNQERRILEIEADVPILKESLRELEIKQQSQKSETLEYTENQIIQLNERMTQKIENLDKKIQEVIKEIESNKKLLAKVENSKELLAEMGKQIKKLQENEIVDISGHYWVYKTKVILDTQKKLEWYVSPGGDMNYNNAKIYVKNLSVAGGNWRLPTKSELEGLYDPKKKSGKNACIDPVFEIGNASHVWMKEHNQHSSYYFDFSSGLHNHNFLDSSYRVFAVRPAKHSD